MTALVHCQHCWNCLLTRWYPRHCSLPTPGTAQTSRLSRASLRFETGGSCGIAHAESCLCMQAASPTFQDDLHLSWRVRLLKLNKLYIQHCQHTHWQARILILLRPIELLLRIWNERMNRHHFVDEAGGVLSQPTWDHAEAESRMRPLERQGAGHQRPGQPEGCPGALLGQAQLY